MFISLEDMMQAGGDSRPYSSLKTMAKDNKERIHYIRKMSSTVEPSDDEEKDKLNSLVKLRNDFTHGDNIAVSIDTVINYFKSARKILEILKMVIIQKKV